MSTRPPRRGGQKLAAAVGGTTILVLYVIAEILKHVLGIDVLPNLP